MRRLHPAWIVAAVTSLSLLAASAFRSTTGVLIQPLMDSTGLSMETVSGAASLNLIVYGIATPFTAALMESWGVRRAVVLSMLVVALSSAATLVMTSPWHLWMLWGVLIGLGTGALALTFGTIVANRWFVAHRNLVTGVFSAASAAGQVLFVPLIAAVAASSGWQSGAVIVSACALLAALACLLLLRDRPSDVGATPLGAEAAALSPDAPAVGPDPTRERPLVSTLRVLRAGSRRWAFWTLLGTFFICGWSTNGIVVTHLVPAAHDHAMPSTLAASIIGIIGIFNVIGTIASGWLTDRFDPRWLLTIYYLTRGISLIFLHDMLGPGASVPLWAWVVFYGLDWTATVPPTVELCRRHLGLADSGVAFGWIYAAHMIGAGIGASVSGVLRAQQGTYEWAWMLTAVLCVVAGCLPLTVRRRGPEIPGPPAVVSW